MLMILILKALRLMIDLLFRTNSVQNMTCYLPRTLFYFLPSWATLDIKACHLIRNLILVTTRGWWRATSLATSGAKEEKPNAQGYQGYPESWRLPYQTQVAEHGTVFLPWQASDQSDMTRLWQCHSRPDLLRVPSPCSWDGSPAANGSTYTVCFQCYHLRVAPLHLVLALKYCLRKILWCPPGCSSCWQNNALVTCSLIQIILGLLPSHTQALGT